MKSRTTGGADHQPGKCSPWTFGPRAPSGGVEGGLTGRPAEDNRRKSLAIQPLLQVQSSKELKKNIQDAVYGRIWPYMAAWGHATRHVAVPPDFSNQNIIEYHISEHLRVQESTMSNESKFFGPRESSKPSSQPVPAVFTDSNRRNSTCSSKSKF